MIGALIERHPRFANWLYGFTPPERGTVVLVHRRVYIVPAQLGWFFVLTLLILLIGSINYTLSLGFGLTFLLAAQVLVNAGMALSLLPTKGMALPFLSYGISSVVSSSLAAGILLSVSGGAGGFLRRPVGGRR